MTSDFVSFLSLANLYDQLLYDISSRKVNNMGLSSVRSILSISIIVLLLSSFANAHAGHGAPPPASADEDWATLHMRGE